MSLVQRSRKQCSGYWSCKKERCRDCRDGNVSSHGQLVEALDPSMHQL